ncbi:MAG: 16S rRNA (guanine(527)-N(7))-methyltransferase RsmG, partial [Candidatus Goldiibacteriota bacterium]
TELFDKYLTEAGCDFCTAEHTGKFLLYAEELKEWNKKFNLTAVEGLREVIIKHFIDSLMLVKTYKSLDNLTIVDIGTGAGFPGIPASIVSPSSAVTLLESNSKKISFLNHIKIILGLKNLEIIEGRSEILSREKKYREFFDIAVMRALAPYPIAMEIAAGFVKPGGSLAYFASLKQLHEIKENNTWLGKLGCRLDKIFEYELPEGSGKFCIATACKQSLTHIKYPRLYSMIKKKPL